MSKVLKILSILGTIILVALVFFGAYHYMNQSPFEEKEVYETLPPKETDEIVIRHENGDKNQEELDGRIESLEEAQAEKGIPNEVVDDGVQSTIASIESEIAQLQENGSNIETESVPAKDQETLSYEEFGELQDGIREYTDQQALERINKLLEARGEPLIGSGSGAPVESEIQVESEVSVNE